MTGLYATVAIEAALLEREKTGLGQHIDMALLDVQLAGLANQAMSYLSSGQVPRRYGNAHANIVPYQVFRASDRDFIVACGNDGQFKALCESVGLRSLLNDPRFGRNAERVAHRDALEGILSRHFVTDTADRWVRKIHEAGVPVGAINDIQQALDEPQVRARGMVTRIPHRLNPDFRVVGSPIKLSRTPVEYSCPPPLLGQDTAAVLRRLLDLDGDRIANLEAQGVIECFRG
jgi:crotonobetainyl-CoA:carnitine CoA-transferase CaiB-like acyl-CoA transferase